MRPTMKQHPGRMSKRARKRKASREAREYSKCRDGSGRKRRADQKNEIGKRSVTAQPHALGSTVGMVVASWNVRSLRSGTRLKMIEGEFDEMKCYNLDKLQSIQRTMTEKNIWVMAIQDTRLPSKTCNLEGGWTLLSRGRESVVDGRAAHGVALLLSPAATRVWKQDGKWQTSPKDEEGQWLYATFPIQPSRGEKGRRLVIMSAYGPTDCKYDGDKMIGEKIEAKDKFWDRVEEALVAIPTHWPVILMGDFNARVSNYNACTTEEGVTGSGGNTYRNVSPVSANILGIHNLPARSDNGDRLISLCENHGMCIANTYFRRQKGKTYSHTYGRGVAAVLDHAIIRRWQLAGVQNVIFDHQSEL